MLALILMLGGCGSKVKKTLGLERVSPDEFAVYQQAPLAMPPDFRLEPPKPGTPRPQNQGAARTAERLITTGQENRTVTPSTRSPSTQSEDNGSLTPGEALILNKAGADAAQKNIRDTLRAEHGVIPETEKTNRSVVEKILGRNSGVEGKKLDPVKEARALNEQGLKAPNPPIIENNQDQ